MADQQKARILQYLSEKYYRNASADRELEVMGGWVSLKFLCTIRGADVIFLTHYMALLGSILHPQSSRG